MTCKKLFLGLGMTVMLSCSSGSSGSIEEPQDPTPPVTDITAQQWNKGVVGWNLGNQLECPPTGWDNESTAFGNPSNASNAETAWGNPRVTKAMINAVKAAGFNAIRIPVRWQCHITDATNMTVSTDWMNRVKEVVDYCISNDMKVIINTHHDKWLESRPTNSYKSENNQKLKLLWTQIANTFKDYGYELAFAGTNEVHLPDNWNSPTTENQTVQNSYNQTFVDAVRATGGNNRKRHLIVQTYNCSLDFGLDAKTGGFIVPRDIEGNGNSYLSVEIHYYTPWDYCGDTKYDFWGNQFKQYGTTPASNETSMKTDFDQATTAWGNKGLGVVIGEWGVTNREKEGLTDKIHENMTYYCRCLTKEAKQHGFSCFVWDNNAFGSGTEKFGIFDRDNNMATKSKWILTGIF